MPDAGEKRGERCGHRSPGLPPLIREMLGITRSFLNLDAATTNYGRRFGKRNRIRLIVIDQRVRCSVPNAYSYFIDLRRATRFAIYSSYFESIDAAFVNLAYAPNLKHRARDNQPGIRRAREFEVGSLELEGRIAFDRSR